MRTIYTYSMVPGETVSFVFPRCLDVSRDEVEETSGLDGKQN